MALAKLKKGLSVFYSFLVFVVFGLWAVFYVIFRFLIPLKWERWRAASKFKKHLVKEGIPEDKAKEITDSQISKISLISIWRWWRALEKGREREHRGEAEGAREEA